MLSKIFTWRIELPFGSKTEQREGGGRERGGAYEREKGRMVLMI